jgi:hypothetical protein
MPRIKGTALIPAVKVVRKFRDKLRPNDMNEEGMELVGQRVLPGVWYPIEAASQIMIAVNKVLGSSSLTTGMEFIAGDLAESDLRGVYQDLITVGDVARSLRRSSILWRNYFDEGTVTMSVPDPKAGQAVARLEGFEQSIPYCQGIAGMAKVVVRMAGQGKTCEVSETKCTLRGDPLCEFHYRWSTD